jgi:hypothetical protein
MALIVALLVVFIVGILCVTITQIAIHNTEQSAYSRKRVHSVSAAEGGIDYVWNQLENQGPESFPWDSGTQTGSMTGALGTGPGTASFDATLTYYDANGTAFTSAPSQTNIPASVLVTSVGTTNGDVRRQVQTLVRLSPIREGVESAVVANSASSFANNFTINGNQGNDGDISIATGNLTIQQAPNVYGNVYVANGSLTVRNNVTVHGDAWAWNAVDLRSPGTVLGNLQSSTGALLNNGNVGKDARAGTTISATLNVTGSRYPNSPTTQRPPSIPFPLVCWTSSGSCVGSSGEWTSDLDPIDGQADYTVQTFSGANACSNARSFLTGGTITVNTVVRISTVCTLDITLNDTITFNGHLAIFTDGAISMATQNTWSGQNNNKLMLIVNYRNIFPASCSSSYNITTGQYSNFNNVYVSFYTPCTLNMNNLNSFSGQMIARTVNITNNFTMNYKPVLFAGLGDIIGFRQDVVYVREIA